MQLTVESGGAVHCIYDETIDLSAMGALTITRASQVEPDAEGRWWANLSPVDGPLLGPFSLRSEALSAERTWLESNWVG